jgi:hypothetical protein
VCPPILFCYHSYKSPAFVTILAGKFNETLDKNLTTFLRFNIIFTFVFHFYFIGDKFKNASGMYTSWIYEILKNYLGNIIGNAEEELSKEYGPIVALFNLIPPL